MFYFRFSVFFGICPLKKTSQKDFLINVISLIRRGEIKLDKYIVLRNILIYKIPRITFEEGGETIYVTIYRGRGRGVTKD